MERRRPSSETVVYGPHAVIEPAFADNNIPVFFGCDDKFLPHALTAIASLMTHANPRNNYDLFIVQAGIPRGRMDAATEWIRRYPNARLRFVDIDPMVEEFGRRYFITTREYSIAVFFRIFAPRIFERYDKVIYLDSDLVLFVDVSELFGIDLEGNEVGACHDYVSEHQCKVNPSVREFWRRELDMEPGGSYFCSSELVMDLKQMRENGSMAAMLEKIRHIRGSKLPDQDVMNATMKNRVKFIGDEWNCMDWMYDREEEASGFRLLDAKGLAMVRAARDNAKVLHFAEKKPWTLDYIGKNGDLYWKYAAETPFYGDLLADLLHECRPWSLFAHGMVITGQEWNFRMRSLFCSDFKKKQYEFRLHNLRLRRAGLVRQAALVRGLAANGGGEAVAARG